MMKKDYLKPEMDVTEFLGSVLMLIASNGNESELPGEGGETDEFGANDRRGSWGDFWN